MRFSRPALPFPNATLLAAGKHLSIYRIWRRPSRVGYERRPPTFAARLGKLQVELPAEVATWWVKALTPRAAAV